MKTVLIAFLCIILIAALGMVKVRGNLTYAGAALDLKTNEFYYSENHEEIMDRGEHIATNITYWNAENKIIARKKLNYRIDKVKPAFQMEDMRSGFMEGAVLDGARVKVFYRDGKGCEIKSGILNVPEPAVIDGGFNYFVKANWNAVFLGQKIKFNMVVPERLDYYAFHLVKDREIKFSGKEAVVCMMEPDNFILRQLLDPIVLTYDIHTRRLLKYEGISNINNENGNRYVVRISYPLLGP